jgi:pilus assembly protein CpaE
MDVVNPGLVFTRDREAARIIEQSLHKTSGLRASVITGDLASALKDPGALTDAGFVIVDVSQVENPIDGFNAIADVLPPSTPVVVIGDTNDIRVYRGLRQAGAAEYFFRPLVGDLITGTLNRLLFDNQVQGNARQGKLIHFIGVRGGSGATSIAIRTARMLSDDPPRPVLLMDLNLRSSDMAMQVNLQPNGAVYEALDNADRIDDLFLERTLSKVTDNLDLMSTLDPLNKPIRLGEAPLLTLFSKLANRYRYLVTEVPTTSVSGLNQLLRLGSTVVLVSDGRMASARDVARWRALLSSILNGVTLVHVVNRFDLPDALPLDQFAKLAGGMPDLCIPYSKQVAEASVLGAAGDEGFEHLDAGLEPLIAMISGTARTRQTGRASLLDRLLRRT